MGWHWPKGQPRPFYRTKWADPAMRLWSNIVKQADGCWIWQNKPTTNGYAQIVAGGKRIGVHRLAYELTHGPIGNSDLFVCHKCDVRLCVNPDHLFLGTHSDNMRDCIRKDRYVSANGTKTHCRYGHEFSPENTGHGKPGSRTRRYCRECHRRKGREYELRRKLRASEVSE